MGKLIKGTHHVALRCADYDQYEKALDFYGNVLGLDFIRSWGEGSEAGAMFNTGNSIIELFASGKAVDGSGNINHYSLATDDVDACIEVARAAGYEILIEPNEIVIPSAVPYPARIGFCRGPVGEEIEFFCER